MSFSSAPSNSRLEAKRESCQLLHDRSDGDSELVDTLCRRRGGQDSVSVTPVLAERLETTTSIERSTLSNAESLDLQRSTPVDIPLLVSDVGNSLYVSRSADHQHQDEPYLFIMDKIVFQDLPVAPSRKSLKRKSCDKLRFRDLQFDLEGDFVSFESVSAKVHCDYCNILTDGICECDCEDCAFIKDLTAEGIEPNPGPSDEVRLALLLQTLTIIILVLLFLSHLIVPRLLAHPRVAGSSSSNN